MSKWLGVCLLALWTLDIGLGTCFAELTATVSPGYTFSYGERSDSSKLNRLGLPTITITGTLDGTNAGISAGSINANMFSSTVVDDATLYFTNSSPQAIAIKAAGVGAREISSSIAGPGLTGGSGAILTNNVDGITVRITNDVVTLGTNLPLSYFTYADTNALNFYTNLMALLTYTSAGTAVSSITADGLYINAAHSLPGSPKFMHAFIECAVADGGYVPGDEVDSAAIDFTNAGVAEDGSALVPWCNATNCGVTVQAPASGWLFANKTNGATFTPTAARWNLKIRVRL